MNAWPVLLLVLAACAHEVQPANDLWFEDRTTKSGLLWQHHAFNEQRFDFPEIMGGGVAVFDADVDGDLDVLLVDSGDLRAPRGAQGSSRFFENQGGARFIDATARAGFGSHDYGMGVACGDYDNDGDVDVFVSTVGTSALYRNEDGRFVECALQAHAAVEGWSASAGFLDYDGDGWLDLFVVRYVDWSPQHELDCRALDDRRDYCSPVRYDAPSSCVMLHNRGDGTFEDVSERVGLSSVRTNGLGLASGAFGAQLQRTLIVASDMLPNHAFVAQADGLRDRAPEQGLALNAVGFAASGMGIQAVDFDDDGDLDVFVTHLRRQGNALYVQAARGHFRDEAARAGLFRPSLPFTGFGCGFADFDNDGDLDLYVANGRVNLEQPMADASRPYAEFDQLFAQGDGGRFEEILPRTRFAQTRAGSSRAMACGDLDNDGGVDLVVVEQGEPVRLLLNRAARAGRWIGFRVLDEHGRDAIGARVEIKVGGRSRYREVNPVHGYLSSNDPRVHFGLGSAGALESVRVRWLDGTISDFRAPVAGAYYTLERAKSQ